MRTRSRNVVIGCLEALIRGRIKLRRPDHIYFISSLRPALSRLYMLCPSIARIVTFSHQILHLVIAQFRAGIYGELVHTIVSDRRLEREREQHECLRDYSSGYEDRGIGFFKRVRIWSMRVRKRWEWITSLTRIRINKVIGILQDFVVA